jgi:hypothetical protein
MTYYHLTKISANAKTGPIPVSTSSRDTCPNTCPFLKNGCYADAGPLAIHWNKVQQGRGVDIDQFVAQIKSLPKNQLWRHNQAGDLSHVNGAIDAEDLTKIIAANRGKNGFTYTHHDLDVGDNAQLIRHANQCNFTINLSANNLHHADHLADLQIAPVVVALPSNANKKTVRTTPRGRKVIICPATTTPTINCANCRLCAHNRGNAIIGFPAHGLGRRKVDIITKT